MVTFIEGLINNIDLKKKTITLKKANNSLVIIRNIKNINILKKFNYKYQKILLYFTKTEKKKNYKIINISLPEIQHFRKLLDQIIGINSYFKINDITPIFNECNSFLNSSNEILRWSDILENNINSEILIQVQGYIYYLDKLSFNNLSDNLISIKDKIFAKIYNYHKFKRIPNILCKLLKDVEQYNNKYKYKDFNISDKDLLNLPINNLLDSVFINIDIESVKYFWNFFTKDNNEIMLEFIINYCKFRLQNSNYLVNIYKVISKIILLLKENSNDTYITYNTLCVNLYNIKNLDQVLDFIENQKFIKIVKSGVKKYITLFNRYNQEVFITNFIKARMGNDSDINIDIESIKVTLNNKQKKFLVNFNNSDISILIGKPGTGKSFVTSQAINNMNVNNIAVLGPTGMAVKNIEKKINRKIIFNTIHRFISRKDLDIDVLVIDEFGMVSTKLLYKLFNFIDTNLPNLEKIIFIGDSNQLEPIGYGSPLKQLVYSERICITKLDKIVRQNDSIIPEVCNFINNGDYINTLKKFKIGGKGFIDKLVFYNDLPYNILDNYDNLNLSAIANTNNACYKINKYIQDNVFNRGYIYELNTKFFIGDKIIILKNDYTKNVVNGDFGHIIEIEYNGNSKNLNVKILLINNLIINYSLKVKKRIFDNGINKQITNIDKLSKIFIYEGVKYYVNNILENCPFNLGYCTTVHKYQGSETNLGLIYIDSLGSYIQSRNLLYTAISRCKDKIVLVGNISDIKKIIERKNIDSFSYINVLMQYNNIKDDNIGIINYDFIERYNNFNWKNAQTIKKGDIILETNWKEYNVYNGLTFKEMIKKYNSENLAYVFINKIIEKGREDKIKSNNIKLFYNYLKKRMSKTIT